MSTKYFFIILILFSFSIALAQSPIHSDRYYTATRIEKKPKIDGDLGDDTWCMIAEEYNGYFAQSFPDNGEPSKYKTRFMLVYDDNSIYFAAQLYDDHPDEIPTELSERDQLRRNADYIGITFDPYKQGQNGVGFYVTAAGVQVDRLLQTSGGDDNWDAVWNSAVRFNEQGWTVEMEIPYQAIRFPKKDIQEWGFNVERSNRRDRIRSTWNFINQEISGSLNQAGTLIGIQNIEPPIRLQLFPYLSGQYQVDGVSGINSQQFSGGMDVRYGLNESFTLDMTLVPDFSQVRSDNLILNLSPFEQRFNENRPFFTEGTELFGRGGLLYSRRIGGSRGTAQSELNDSELVVSTPSNAPLINATKISGRTNKGWGLGMLNAISRRTYKEVLDTLTGTVRQELHDPLTNYNVSVIDRNLRNNSNIGLINTNVYRGRDGRNANVSWLETDLRDVTNSWRFSGGAGYSHISELDAESDSKSVIDGFKYFLYAGKISGNFQFNFRRNVESDNWEINDLGFQRAPNEVSHRGEVQLRTFKPLGIFNIINFRLTADHSKLYNPDLFRRFNTGARLFLLFENFWDVSWNMSLTPVSSYDYFEPRVWGRYFTQEPSYNMNFSLGSDSRKAFAIDFNAGIWKRDFDGAFSDYASISPRIRASDKLTLRADLNYSLNGNNKGYVSRDNDDTIYFGNRDVETITSQMTVLYSFTNKMNLSLRGRNYWSRVDYDNYYLLGEDGYLKDTDYTGMDEEGESKHDRDFTVFNIDLIYIWQIAPGSFLNFTYKKSNLNSDNQIQNNYWVNLDETLRNSGSDSFSVKLIYFLDYATLFGRS